MQLTSLQLFSPLLEGTCCSKSLKGENPLDFGTFIICLALFQRSHVWNMKHRNFAENIFETWLKFSRDSDVSLILKVVEFPIKDYNYTFSIYKSNASAIFLSLLTIVLTKSRTTFSLSKYLFHLLIN